LQNGASSIGRGTKRGLVIIDLQIQNMSLLSKWIINLLNGERAWQILLRNKYLSSKSLIGVQTKLNGAHFWRGLMKITYQVLSCESFQIKDGTQTRIWEDKWVDTRPFKEVYPTIFNIARYPHAMVATIMRTKPLNISFKRALVDIKSSRIGWPGS
jgi:hypothetical protein